MTRAQALSALGAALEDPGVALVAAGGTLVPFVSRAALEDDVPSLYAETMVGLFSDVDLVLPTDGVGALGGALNIPVETVESGFDAPSSFVFVVQSEGYLSMWAGSSQSLVEDTLGVSDTTFSDIINVIVDGLRFSDRASAFETVTLAAASDVGFADRVSHLFETFVASNLSLTDSTTTSRLAMASVVDELIATSVGTAQQTVTLAVATAMAFADLARFGFDLNATSSLALADALVTATKRNMDIIDSLVLTDAATGSVTVHTMVSDTLGIIDTSSITALFNTTVVDTLRFTVRVRIGDEQYIGYSVNLGNTATSEYDNFAVNSFGELQGRLYGAMPDGIYLLEGSDDAGSDIAAAVRTGLNNYNNEQLKKVLNAYIGYTSTGRLVLKTITTHKGVKQESWYALNPRAPSDTSDNRFTVAKGLDSVYWQFELVNIDGADFALDNIKLTVLPLQRRYTGR
jgi:hypothetical protein